MQSYVRKTEQVQQTSRFKIYAINSDYNTHNINTDIMVHNILGIAIVIRYLLNNQQIRYRLLYRKLECMMTILIVIINKS